MLTARRYEALLQCFFAGDVAIGLGTLANRLLDDEMPIPPEVYERMVALEDQVAEDLGVRRLQNQARVVPSRPGVPHRVVANVVGLAAPSLSKRHVLRLRALVHAGTYGVAIDRLVAWIRQERIPISSATLRELRVALEALGNTENIDDLEDHVATMDYGVRRP